MASAAVVVQRIHAAGVRSLTDLDIASSGRIDVTVKDDKKALEITSGSTTTTMDAGAKKLEMRTPTSYTRANTVGAVSSTEVLIRTGGSGPSATSSVVKATAAQAIVGTGVNDVPGGILTTDANSVNLNDPTQNLRLAQGKIAIRGRQHTMVIGGTEIMNINSERVAINVDVEIDGTLNTITGTTSTTRVEDPIIQVSTGATTESAVSNGDSGFRIDTVPGETGDATYMGSFLGANGAPLFVNGTGDVNVSNAVSSRVFDKGFLHAVGTGAKTIGVRTPAARMNEPAWTVSGGAIRIVRVVPVQGEPGKCARYTMVMRVTDVGTFEVIRVKHVLTYNSVAGSYDWSAPELTVMQKAGV